MNILNIFKQQDFWHWLFSFDKSEFPSAIFEQFTAVCESKNGYLEISFPVNTHFSLCVRSNCEFEEEFLYLKVNNIYYILGWFDCHNHEDVFKFDEFYQLMKMIEKEQATILYQTSFLFLSRYVVLTNEEEAKNLMQSCLDILSTLCSSDEPTGYVITKHEWYGREVLDMPFKFKYIENNLSSIKFTIKESFVWDSVKLGKNQLNCARFGFAIHSLRHTDTINDATEPFDFDNQNKGWDEYVFPHKIWHQLLNADSQ